MYYLAQTTTATTMLTTTLVDTNATTEPPNSCKLNFSKILLSELTKSFLRYAYDQTFTTYIALSSKGSKPLFDNICSNSTSLYIKCFTEASRFFVACRA